MNILKLKYKIHQHFRLMYDVTLTQSQLDDIHEFYHEIRKQSLKDLIYYRFINMSLTIVMIVVLSIFGQPSWILIALLALFVIYNQIHGIINWIQYKRIKQPIRPSDE